MKTINQFSLLVAAAALMTAATHAQLTFAPETFTTAASTAADGWVPSTNPPPPIGWVGSTNAGGPPGELGGHCVMSNNISSFARRLGFTLDLTTNLSGSGSFSITNSSSYDILNAVGGFGFFDSSQVGGTIPRTFVGLTFQEFGNPTNWRSRGGFNGTNGGNRLITAFFLPTNYHGAYTFKWDYNPTNGGGLGQFTERLFTNNVLIGAAKTINLLATGEFAKTNMHVDSFGVFSGQSGQVGFMDVFFDNLQAVIGPPPTCIQSDTTGTSAIGSSNQVVSILIPNTMNATSNATVTITSLNTNIAVPQGSVNGVLVLTYPTGTSPAQTFNVIGVGVGSTVFTVSNNVGVCVDNFVGISVFPAPRTLPTKTENFNSAASAGTNGWVEYQSRVMGNNYGFDTNGFAGPAGEAGGHFAYAMSNSYYADVFPGTLTLNDNISASGTFELQTAMSNDTVRIGHFLSTSPTNSPTMIGIEVAEPPLAGPGSGRIFAEVSIPGFAVARTLMFNAIAGQIYNWNYGYDPLAGQLAVHFDDGNGGNSDVTIALNSAQRSSSFSVDSFGIFGPGTGYTTNAPDTGEFYVDSVSYIAGVPALRIINIAVVGSNIQITYITSKPGQNHTVEQTSSLSPTSWSTVSGVSYTTSGSTMTATFPKPAGGPNFYRVILP